MNLDEESAQSVIDAAQKIVDEGGGAVTASAPGDTETAGEFFSGIAEPKEEDAPVRDENKVSSVERDKRIKMFLDLGGVGEAGAHALADAGYSTIGDLLADSAEEVAQKTDLSTGVARTMQIAAERFMQEKRDAARADSNED